MKKKLLFIILSFVVLSLSCSKEDINEESIEIKSSPITFRCYAEDVSDKSKTVITGSDYKSINWLPGDEINVFYKGASYKFTSANTVESKDVNFTGSISGTITDIKELDSPVYALYPYNENATISGNKISTTLPNVQRAKEGSFDNKLFISVGVMATQDPDYGIIKFRNVCSGLYFTVTNSGIVSVELKSNNNTALAGDVTVTIDDNGDIVGAPVVQNGESVIIVNAPDASGFKPNTRYYIVTLPGSQSGGITMTAKTATGYYARGASKSVTFVRSRMNKAIDFDKGLSKTEYNNIEDLSTKDIHGTTIQRTTANCYIVKKAGVYKIPMVYGNAIKNGADNQGAYKSTATSLGILQNFVDHTRSGITQPWVSKSHSITKAELVWQDAPNMLAPNMISITGTSGVKEEKYLIFEVQNFVKGNAVIAVYDSNNEIAWSWHIWCYDGDLTAIPVIGINNKTYDFLPVNLGWEGVSNTFYQWGRKDPMLPGIPIDGGKQQNKTWYDKNNVASTFLSTMYVYYTSNPTMPAVGEEFIKHSILNPRKWLTHVNENTAMDGAYTNLWSINAVASTTPPSGHKVIKTVYDPSPVGYCLPDAGIWKCFSTGVEDPQQTGFHYQNGYTDFENGIRYAFIYTDLQKTSTIKFPLIDNRMISHRENGYITGGFHPNYNISAAYWTANGRNIGTSGTNYAYGYGFTYDENYQGKIHSHACPGFTYPGSALSVRPVRED